MSYILGGSTIKRPNQMREGNSTQVVQHRPLKGNYSRDYFGSNKRIWSLDYVNTQKTYYDAIKTIYDTYLSTGTGVSWQVTDANYTVSSTTVHVDLLTRGFSVKGDSYLSDFELILTEL